MKIIYTVTEEEGGEEIFDKGYGNTLLLVTKAIDKIMLGGHEVTGNDLVSSKLLGQKIQIAEFTTIENKKPYCVFSMVFLFSCLRLFCQLLCSMPSVDKFASYYYPYYHGPDP